MVTGGYCPLAAGAYAPSVREEAMKKSDMTRNRMPTSRISREVQATSTNVNCIVRRFAQSCTLVLVLTACVTACVAACVANAQTRSSPASVGSIERLDPALDQLIAPDARIELLASGFDWAEGPVWRKNGGYLLFSDVPRNTIYKWQD